MSYRIPLAISAVVLTAGIALADGQEPAKPSNSESTQTATRSRPRIRFGGLTVNAGYSYMSGPFYSPFYYPYYSLYRPWGAYGWGWPYFSDPFLYGAYVHPGFYSGFGYHPSMGEVKLRTADKEAWVYLDGALAGKAVRLKSMWLEAGAYQLEIRSGAKKFGQKVYVLSGKTLRLTADLDRGEVRP